MTATQHTMKIYRIHIIDKHIIEAENVQEAVDQLADEPDFIRHSVVEIEEIKD